MKYFKHIGFSLVFSLISFLVVFLFPVEVITSSEPLSSPYFAVIEEMLQKKFLSPDEYEKFQMLNEKNEQWFRERREQQLSGEDPQTDMVKLKEQEIFSKFLNIKSGKNSYIYTMIWALLSYLYLIKKPLKDAPLLLSFPVLFFAVGVIPISALLFIIFGIATSLAVIKYVNPLLEKYKR